MASKALRNVILVLSVLAAAFFAYQTVLNLSFLKNTVSPEIYLIRIALALSGFLFCILGGWVTHKLIGGSLFAGFGAVMVLFAGSVSASPLFVWYLLSYAGFCYVLYRVATQAENTIAGISVDREQFQNEKNDLEIAHKAKGEGISILFEKYSTYYNLRKLAEDMAASLSVTELAHSIVKHCQDFVGQGDVALLSLTHRDGPQLALSAYRAFSKSKPWDPVRHHGADLFDQWVIKNQRRLIVTDAHQDFRFDLKETVRLSDRRSLIITPLLHERRVIGTLRINASTPDTFSNDDLRLLDTIAVLASSAISNAMLYERTEELAIKDSLTNLYVRRYFFDRLKEEHRRALLTHRPLSLLMCDLDHFKDCNDKYGHAVGDLMLIEFAKTLTQSVENAIVARYGGEEFSVILPETSKEQAVEIAEKIRKAVEQTPFMHRRQPIAMTISIGVANLPLDALDLEALVHKADLALYQAKKEGRNRVCSSGS
jgi:diguanylate cyclase (GGDEF)-like protein